MRAGIVSMMRNPGRALSTFVDYHRALGFSDFIILFDDPEDPDLVLASTLSGVTVIAVDAEVRKSWQTLRHYEQCRDHVDTTVGARQLLNIEYGFNVALAMGIDWLLHIDIDELFYIKDNDLQAHLAHLEHSNKQAAAYYNYEAVPDRLEYDDYFREVSVFKKPVKLLQHQNIDRAASWPSGRRYFNFYNNGKSMTRVLPGGYPLGAHRWTNDRQQLEKVLFFNPCILHFAVCGFDLFEQKYRHRGNFSDIRIDKDMRRNGALLDLDARDAFACDDLEAARQIYQDRVMMKPEQQQHLIDAGLLRRFSLAPLL